MKINLPERYKDSELGVQVALANYDLRDGKISERTANQLQSRLTRIIEVCENTQTPITVKTQEEFRDLIKHAYDIFDNIYAAFSDPYWCREPQLIR